MIEAHSEQPQGSAAGNVRTVVILGGGTAGWMTAAALARYLGQMVEITVVESEEIGTVGVGEATIPSIRRFHAALGIGEAEFLQETGATHKLGIEFVDWREEGDSYFHGFGKHGLPVDGVGFLHAYLRVRAENGEPLWRYSPNAVAAAAGRFGGPSGIDRRMANGFPYAFHLDALRYARLLRSYAEARGVSRIEGIVGRVTQDDAGDVVQLELRDGHKIAGDLFVDCSGGRAVLIGEAQGVGWEDWSRFLPCDRAAVVQTEAIRAPVPYTRATAMPAGWRWSIPLQHRVGNGYVYSSAHCSPEEAQAALLAAVEGKPLAAPRVLSFRTGQRWRFWHRNVVAIGLSAGFLEPLESTSIHLIQTGITQLLNLFPNGRASPDLADEYNRLMRSAFEHIRDFVVLHYFATNRAGWPFWDHVRQIELPETLERRIRLFREHGRFVRDENELFTVDNWLAVMVGQGIIPRSHSRLAGAISTQVLTETLEGLAGEIRTAVQTMRPYAVS